MLNKNSVDGNCICKQPGLESLAFIYYSGSLRLRPLSHQPSFTVHLPELLQIIPWLTLYYPRDHSAIIEPSKPFRKDTFISSHKSWNKMYSLFSIGTARDLEYFHRGISKASKPSKSLKLGGKNRTELSQRPYYKTPRFISLR